MGRRRRDVLATAFAVLTACAAVLGPARAAPAAERLWTARAGGPFGDGANWDDGLLAPPGPGDTAVFDLPFAYAVTFLEPRTTERTLVQAGAVTFDLAGAAYDLAGTSPLAPGLAVGVHGGETAELRLTGGVATAHDVTLGLDAGATGAIVLSGPAARLDAVDHVTIGRAGTGILEVVDGAALTSRRGIVGATGGSTGSALVDGPGSTWTCNELVTVATNGTGELTVSGGGTVACPEAVVAAQAGAVGDVVVQGADSRWEIDGSLDVGLNGTGSLLVRDGGSVVNHGFATIGTYPGSLGAPPGSGAHGTVTVRGAGSTWSVESFMFDGDLFVGLAGVGVLRAERGGRVLVTGDLVASDNSADGDTAPIVICLASPGDYLAPAIAVTGTADLQHVRVELLDGAAATPGATYRLVESGEALDVGAVELPQLAAPLSWAVTQSAGVLAVSVVSGDCGSGDDDDCNGNGVLDACEIDDGTSADCDGDGVPDSCAIEDGTAGDCNGNGVPDACDIALGGAEDCDGDGVPDACEALPIGMTLTATDGADGARFGAAVAIDGSRLIVGAPFDDGIGAAYIYRLIDDAWRLDAKLVPEGGDPDGRFGTAVDVDGDVAVVGAPGENLGAGRATVYRNVQGRWTVDQVLPGFGGDTSRVGESVTVDGDLLAIGAILHAGDNRHAIADIHEYRVLGSGRFWLARARIQPLAELPSNSFRVPSLDLSGERIAIGTIGVPRGAVTVYGAFGQLGVEEHRFLPPGLAFTYLVSDPTLGLRVPLAFDDDVLAIGGRSFEFFRPVTGVVWVHRRVDGAWEPEAVLEPLAAPRPQFGHSVDLDGDTLVVGDDEGAGAAIVFERVRGTWIQRARLVAPDGADDDGAGVAIGLSGPTVVVGAPGDATNGTDAGAAHVFVPDGTDCDENGMIDHCEIAADPTLDANTDGRLDACGPVCPGDLDGDGTVGGPDLDACLRAWGPCPPGAACPADLDGNGSVGFFDLSFILGAWGPCPSAAP